MANLHLSKVAFSCASYDTLARRQQARVADGVVPLVTRFMPKRADELIGGSLYWIVKHRLIARNRILGFATRAQDGRTIIRLDPDLVRVRLFPKRAHQGWRYLAAEDVPPDLDGEPDGLDALPPALLGKLAGLALV
jgi:hypothetical protein